MWIILFYILPVILGILTVRKINRDCIKEEEQSISGVPSIIVFTVCIIPIINIIALIVIWGITLIDSVMEWVAEIKKNSDFINVKWINRLFGTKN